MMRRDVFQAIADPTRREIMALLSKQEMTPKTIAERFDASRQAISKHLRILKECALLKQTQQGREIYYSLEAEKIEEINQWVNQFKVLWENDVEIAENREIIEKTEKSQPITPSMSKQAVRRFTIC